MVNLSKVLKVKVPPVAILVSGLVIMSLLTALGGILHYGSEIKSYEAASAETLKEQKEQLNQNSKDADKKASANQASTTDSSSRYINGSAYATGDNSGGPASSTYSGSSSVHSKTSYVKVSLSIEGIYIGNITLKAPAYQCDVLRQAQARGLLSVDMSNKEYGQYVVYVINGIGDKSHQRIEWVYKINGSLAPRGCQYMPVKNGDSINWENIN